MPDFNHTVASPRRSFQLPGVLWTTLLVLLILYLIGLILSVGGSWVHALPVIMGLLLLYRVIGTGRRG